MDTWVGWDSEQPALKEGSLSMAECWNWIIFKVPSNPRLSMILQYCEICKYIQYWLVPFTFEFVLWRWDMMLTMWVLISITPFF